jgi:hypothetical protein
MINKNIYFLLAIFTQFLPELFPYSNDVFLLLYLIILITIDKKINSKTIPPFVLMILYFICKLFLPFFPLSKQFLSDFRPFLIFSILFHNIPNIKEMSLNTKITIFFIIIFFLSIPNILGMINPSYYITILKPYYKYVIGGFENTDTTNIAQIAALNGRFSSIFGQPATSGVFFFITTVISFRILYFSNNLNKIIKVLLLLILVLSIFNGIISISAFYQFGFILTIFIYFALRFKFLFYTFISILFTILLFFFSIFSFNDISYFFEYLTSGRYSEDGNILPLMKKIQFQNYFIGFLEIDSSEKSAGDSSFWMKFVQGGLVYIILYYKYLYLNIKNFLLNISKYKLFYKSIFLTIFAGEIGFTAFSQPKATFLYLLLLFFFIEDF